MENLRLKEFDTNRNAILIETDGQRRKVFVSSSVLKKAFITRAWLDQTLIDCAFGKCFLCADVETREGRLEATRVWLSLEENKSNEVFKNFGLELNKPNKNSSAFSELTSLEDVKGKLSKRFLIIENSDKSKSSPDLCNFRFDNEFLSILAVRHLRNANALTGGNLIQADFTPNWRLVTGMGEASVYETNLTLHHVYGVPYIPASTVKGVLRHYLDELSIDRKIVESIFGNGDENSGTVKPVRGECTFFDVFPIKAPRIELDVMTPHYPKYYSEGLPPADWQSPTPIHFLTVGQGTPFRFVIGLPKGILDQELKSNLVVWLKDALEHRGIGAKTAVGYGAFSKHEQNT